MLGWNCQKGGWKVWNWQRRIFLLQPCNKCQAGCWDVGLEFVAVLNFKLERLNSVFHSGSGCWLMQKWNHTFTWVIWLILTRYFTQLELEVQFFFFFLFTSQTCTNFSADEVERNNFGKKITWAILVCIQGYHYVQE